MLKLEDVFDVTPLRFYDAGTGREMLYVYPDTKHSFAGWLLFKARNGNWVTYRKATDEDIETLSSSVVSAHHG
jgi:hypothetical protein